MEAKTDTTAAPAATADHPNRAELAANFRRLAGLQRHAAEVMAAWADVTEHCDASRLDELNVLGAVSSHLHSCLARVHNVATERLVTSDGAGPLLTGNEVTDLRVLSFVAQEGVVEMGPDPLAPAECPAKAEALS